MNTLTHGVRVGLDTWRTGFLTTRRLLRQDGCADHLYVLDALYTDTPPDLDALDGVLAAYGWQTLPVEEPPDATAFFEALAGHRIPVRLGGEAIGAEYALGGGSWARDLLGALPLLLIPHHRWWVEQLALRVARHRFSEPSVRLASRLYWRTAVMGLMREGKSCLWGAALTTDNVLACHALGPFAERLPLHVKRAASTPYDGQPVTRYWIASRDALADLSMVDHLLWATSPYRVCPS